MKTEPGERFETWLQDFMVRHRIAVRQGETWMQPAESESIVSRVPDVVLDQPAEGILARRRIFEFGSGDRKALFRAHIGQEEIGGSWNVVTSVKDRRGVQVHAAIADPGRRVVRLLVDLRSVRPMPLADAGGMIETLAGALVGEPVRSMLQLDGEARVGSNVRARIAKFIADQPGEEAELLRGELSFLEQLVDDCPAVPAGMRRRIDGLRERIKVLAETAPAPEVPEGRVERELGALCRLVEKRTCSFIRLGNGEVAGIANPAPEGSPRGRVAVGFHLRYCTLRGRSILHLEPLVPGDRERWGPVCLGCGDAILIGLLVERDLYGIVDFLMNFIDTNRIGALPSPVRRLVQPPAGAPAGVGEGPRAA